MKSLAELIQAHPNLFPSTPLPPLPVGEPTAEDMCDCGFPEVMHRSGDGHDPLCPAHVPLGSKKD